MSLTIVKYPDPVLAEKAAPIEEITPEIKKLAEDMLEAMYENEGIGLAAPQVGESLRLVVIDLTGPEKKEAPEVFINPEIVEKSGSVSSEEGCLSVVGYRAAVKRAERIKVRALDLDGNQLEFEAGELRAICLQHEIDHLDGKLFIDHISRLKRSMYEKKLAKWKKQERV